MASALEGLLEELDELPSVLRRMLEHEGQFEVDFWVRRLKTLHRITEEADADEQEDLFREA